MQTRMQFYPDIQTKYQHLIAHMNDKNKITSELVNILKQIANLEEFYSTTLDKFANSISKLLVGKDPIKEVLITLDKILTSKSEGSSNLAKQIKDVMIPHIEQSIDTKAQQKLKDSQINVRNIRASMQRKLKMLLASQNNFRKAVVEVNNLPKAMSSLQKGKALEGYRKKQDQFSDTIDSYNSSLDEYMLKYSEICEQLSELQTSRKSHFRDAVGQLVILQINYLKNLQYDYAKYAKQLKKMEGKLLIQDKSLGRAEQFYETKQGGIIQLAKLSNKNYIDSIVGKKKVNESLLGEQLLISDLKSKYPPGQLAKSVYHSLAKTIFSVMNFIHRSNHTNLLIQVVFFSKDLTMSRGDLKVSLLNSLMSHELFSDEKFWNYYQKRLLQKISREQNVTSGDEQMLQNNFNHVLDRDLTMLRNVQINPYISKVIENVCERANIVHPITDTNDAYARPQNMIRIIHTPFKYKVYE